MKIDVIEKIYFLKKTFKYILLFHLALYSKLNIVIKKREENVALLGYT